MRKPAIWTTVSTSVLATLFGFAAPAWAQGAPEPAANGSEEIVVTGIRQSLETALEEKRETDNLVEIIQAEDIGKLPDQNLAEVLENITGIQITREAGVGQGVQIRGTDANRVEINGVATVGAGAGRSGISFDDLAASMISSVQVVKVPDASTIEGSVGGTINLRTIRPLNLDEPLFAFRGQAENSDLSGETLPRYSGTIGGRWDTRAGEFGLVGSFSYAEQDVVAFRPRVDRDAVVTPTSGRASAEAFPFLRIQFLDQDYDNFEYETLNFSGSAEWKPNNDWRFYFDATLNDQERRQDSTRVQVSGVSANGVVDNTTNTSFETVDFGSVEGANGSVDLGSWQAALTGILEPNTTGALDPNLRMSSDNGARVTESRVFALGGEWESDRFSVHAEVSLSTSDTVLPNFSTVLDFINPNAVQPSFGVSIDNGVPIEFDLRGGTLQFGVAQGLATTPTTAQLLDPANYELQQVIQQRDVRENEEAAIRLDFSYHVGIPFIQSIGAGFRRNETNVLNDNALLSTSFSNATSHWRRPRGDLFADILVAGPNNFNEADGRRLYFGDFLIIDGARSFSDPAGVLNALNAAITASNAANTQGPALALIGAPTEQSTAFFEIEETTNAAYLQVNFDTSSWGVPIRGNAGVRYVSTDQSSIGNSVATGGVVTQVVNDSSYEFWLPRFNLVAEPIDNLLIRAGIARDIRRPNFDQLSSSVLFTTNANSAVVAGNPNLEPEAVWSYDLSGEYYFAPGAVVSVGLFHKVRTNLFGTEIENPPTNEVGGVLNISIDPACPGGGIYNPIAIRNINNPTPGVGICVPYQSTFNVDGETTQTGVELALQYDLSGWEDRLGWASGFGFIGNFTYQETGGDPQFYRTVGGARNVFGNLGFSPVPQDRADLLFLSEYAYNVTLFYDRYGLNARLRYTWRSDFMTDEALTSTFDVPRVNGDRGQLNGSISYNINDNVNIGLEAINITQEDAPQYCVNDEALLCFQGLTDRRVIAGINVRF